MLESESWCAVFFYDDDDDDDDNDDDDDDDDDDDETSRSLKFTKLILFSTYIYIFFQRQLGLGKESER